jgi:hypothetical protein
VPASAPSQFGQPRSRTAFASGAHSTATKHDVNTITNSDDARKMPATMITRAAVVTAARPKASGSGGAVWLMPSG